MKNLINVLLIVFSVEISAQINCSMEDIAWLEGSWKRTNAKISQSGYEIWSKKNDSTLLGIGYTLNGPDTVFIERLKILVDAGGCYYVAEVKENDKAVVFAHTRVDSTSLGFENKNHDFPNDIAYYKTAEGMKVTVSGKGKSFFFTFEKED